MDGSGLDRRHRRRAPAGSVGAAIRAARVDVSISQREVARRIARTPSMVSRWESGDREPTVFDLVSIGRVVGVSPAVLVEQTERAGIGRRWSCRATSWRNRAALGRGLRLARREAGISLVGAASASGIPTWRLLRIEAGSDPTIAEVCALRRVVRFDVRALVEQARHGAVPEPWEWR